MKVFDFHSLLPFTAACFPERISMFFLSHCLFARGVYSAHKVCLHKFQHLIHTDFTDIKFSSALLSHLEFLCVKREMKLLCKLTFRVLFLHLPAFDASLTYLTSASHNGKFIKFVVQTLIKFSLPSTSLFSVARVFFFFRQVISASLASRKEITESMKEYLKFYYAPCSPSK